MSINSCHVSVWNSHPIQSATKWEETEAAYPAPPVAISSWRSRLHAPVSEHTLSLFLPLAVLVIHSPSPGWGRRRTPLPLPHCLNTPQRHRPRHPRPHKASSIPPSPSSPEPVELQLFRKLFNLPLRLISALHRCQHTHTLQHSSHRLRHLRRTRI